MAVGDDGEIFGEDGRNGTVTGDNVQGVGSDCANLLE